MWGSNPVIESPAGKCCSVSGCGYDKESTALAEVLRFLFPSGTDEHQKTWMLGGSGVGHFCSELLKFGWKLTKKASGKTFDAFDLEKVEA